MILKGLYTALITPFDPHGKLDEAGLRHLICRQLQSDVDGIVLLGTTGEAPTLTASEKERVIRIGVEEVKGRMPVIVGTGSYSTEQTIVNTRQAQELGADAALVVTPYYNKPTQEGIFRHFEALTKAVSLPICAYNHPGRSGQNIHIETLKRIIQLPNMICVKETSGSIDHLNATIHSINEHNPQVSILSGDDPFTLPLMALGGHGVICVTSNLIPKAMKQLVHSALAGNFQEARQWHYRLLPLFNGIFIETNPIPIKAAMRMCGLAAGACRLPLCELSPANHQTLQAIIESLPQEWILAHG